MTAEAASFAVESNGYSRITINKRAYSAAPPRFPDAARGPRRSAAQDGWRPLVHSLATILPGRRLGRHSKPAGCASRQRVGHNIGRDRVEPFVGAARVLIGNHR